MTAPTILVVEDNPITRKMLRVVLQTEGYAVIEAPDARAALTAAQTALPDLVLQDLILPDMDGLELVRRLRALAGGAELPILALSGFLSRLEESRTAAAAFTALLVKPIEPGPLIDAIREGSPPAHRRRRPGSAQIRADSLRPSRVRGHRGRWCAGRVEGRAGETAGRRAERRFHAGDRRFPVVSRVSPHGGSRGRAHRARLQPIWIRGRQGPVPAGRRERARPPNS